LSYSNCKTPKIWKSILNLLKSQNYNYEYHRFEIFDSPFLTLSFYTAYGQKSNVLQPELAKEIKAIRDEDQKNRIKWSKMYQKGKLDSKKFKEFTKKLIDLGKD